jgi:hypothetical protein
VVEPIIYVGVVRDDGSYRLGLADVRVFVKRPVFNAYCCVDEGLLAGGGVIKLVGRSVLF